jgi:hypothetical protein
MYFPSETAAVATLIGIYSHCGHTLGVHHLAVGRHFYEFMSLGEQHFRVFILSFLETTTVASSVFCIPWRLLSFGL